MNKKLLAALFILAVTLAVVATLAVTVPAIGGWFAATFGPAGAGFINLMRIPLNWALGGGGPTLFAFYGIGLGIVFGFAYIVWTKDIPYKLTGTTPQDNKILGYKAQREPEDPETLTSAKVNA